MMIADQVPLENPGAREIALGFTRAELASCFGAKDGLSRELALSGE